MTPRQAAAQLGVSVTKVRELYRDRRIGHYRVSVLYGRKRDES
jgi:excisionase family DNA binding protein